MSDPAIVVVSDPTAPNIIEVIIPGPQGATGPNGVLSGADRTKLDGIAAGATANSTDAQLRDRATHTGTQAQSTVVNLVSDLAAKQAALVSGTNIKTVAGVSVLGSGDLAVPGTLSAGDRTKFDSIATGATANSSDAVLLARANHTGTQSADTLTDGTTNKAFLATERTKLAGVATGATANSADATLLARANHTGTQSADTLTDGTTNKAFLATERTKLAGVATGATANSADATLLARANHTGTQAQSTIDNLPSDLAAKQPLLVSNTNIKTVGGVTVLGAGDVALKTVNGVSIVGTGDIPIAGAALSGADRTKLDGIAANATANASDAALRDRATHTGTQAISTVLGLQTELDQENVADQTLVFGTTTTWNAALGSIAYLTLTGNTTLSLPTNIKKGRYTLIVDQATPGGRVLTFGTGFRVTPATPVTTDATRSIYSFISDGVTLSGGLMFSGMPLTAGGTGALIGGLPAKVLACYFVTWLYGSYLITDVPLDFNVIYIFTAVPAGTIPAGGNRNNLGDGSFFMPDAGAPQISATNVQICRNRGQKVILTVGGAGAGYNFNTRTKSNNFITSFQTMATALGGVDGIDFNNFEAGITTGQTMSTITTEMNYIATQLRSIYGANFAITCPPGASVYGTVPPGGTIFAPNDATIINALNTAGLLTYAAPQFYDFSGFKTAGTVATFISQYVANIGATKTLVGLSANYDFANALTLAECLREYDAIKAASPTIRGAFCWNAQTNLDGGNQWGSSMKARVGTADGTAPTPSGEQAVLDAFAFGTGQIGAWLDFRAPNLYLLSSDSTPNVLVNPDPVGRVKDRSSGANDAFTTVSVERGIFAPGTASAGVYLFKPLASTTGGGSGEAAAGAGFFISMGVMLDGYYETLWDDTTTANNGRTLKWNSDNDAITFSVGTGASRTSVSVTGFLATAFTPPTGIRVNIKAWQDASTINLLVNNKTLVTATCANVSVGSTNYKLAASFTTPITSDTLATYTQAVWTLSPLTQALRDGVHSFVVSKNA
jgi:chitinase